MNMINKIVSFLKKIFSRQKQVKLLEEPKLVTSQEKKNKFITSLKIETREKSRKKEIEILTCVGDGLGIQKKITS